MPTIVYKGANRISDEGLAGKTLSQIKADDIFVEALGLDGNESIKVNGQSQSDAYTIKAGDAVEFYKNQGTKGAKDKPDEEPEIEVVEEDGDDDEDDEEEDEEEDDDDEE